MKKNNDTEKPVSVHSKCSKALVIASICSIIFLLLLTVCCLFYLKKFMSMNTKELTQKVPEIYSKYYVIITDKRESSFWKSIYEGAMEEAIKKNSYIEIFGSNLNQKYRIEDLMQIAIASEVDGIIIEADESEKMTRLINAASDAGIPVVTALEDNSESKRKSFIGVNNYKLGLKYGEQICELQTILQDRIFEDKKINVLVLMKDVDASGQNITLSGIQDAIKRNGKQSDINVETTVVSNMGAFAAEESIRDIFMKQENIPDIIICMNELNTTCVYQGVVDYNKVGKINIVGYYDSETILKAIERNVIYSTISLNTEQMGMYCVNALDEYLKTGHVNEYFSVDMELITSENVDKYLGGVNEK
jgi:ribose transport system substrate-binding protein